MDELYKDVFKKNKFYITNENTKSIEYQYANGLDVIYHAKRTRKTPIRIVVHPNVVDQNPKLLQRIDKKDEFLFGRSFRRMPKKPRYGIDDNHYGYKFLIKEDELDSFLKELGDIFAKNNLNKNTDNEINSWEVISESVALKTVDKSIFINNCTSVPIEVKDYFDDSLENNEHKKIKFLYKSKEYLAAFHLDKLANSQYRITWNPDFSDLINNILPKFYDIFINDKYVSGIELPKIRFEKHNKDTFLIDFIISDNIFSDLNAEEVEDSIGTKEGNLEGKVKYYYGKKYERDPENRRKAIEFHGTRCMICNFDYEMVYGERGRGFIEIHHIKPLCSLDNETKIDPRTDLIPVCANCHRIIHRDKDNVLSIDNMKYLINEK